MDKIDQIYIGILRAGLPAIRNATLAGDLEYCKIEAEHLHTIPSLFGEKNINRHIFYMDCSRRSYIEWASNCGREFVDDLVKYFYESQWKQLDAILQGTIHGGPEE